jgi:hypothetical protein
MQAKRERERKEKVYINVRALDVKLFVLLSLSIFVVVDDNIGREVSTGK